MVTSTRDCFRKYFCLLFVIHERFPFSHQTSTTNIFDIIKCEYYVWFYNKAPVLGQLNSLGIPYPNQHDPYPFDNIPVVRVREEKNSSCPPCRCRFLKFVDTPIKVCSTSTNPPAPLPLPPPPPVSSPPSCSSLSKNCCQLSKS